MDLTDQQKKLLCYMQFGSLPIVEETEHKEDLLVLRRHGLVRKGSEPFDRYHVTDFGTEALERLEKAGKL